ncbi:phosphatase PAP2 family protein [Neobacillus drentensis]|uniref:phosphatase PAP2 family protein n=1 Tax=Neobacillus drentensis TaxID=220684 RepID=UPI001F3E1C1E|nr:phosphatase PAP2 family protein [Neobacillus drentensis]ULT59124.1 phosphatase PAP2 family protein [Neobacillus drentensis]
MKLKSHLTLAFLISLASIIGFCFMSLWISDHKIIRFDSTIIGYVQGWETPALTRIMMFFTFIGSAPFVVVLSLILLFFLYKVLHHRLELILFVYAVIGSAILNQLLKQFFHRMRPDFNRLIEIGGYSFPSGHAMNAFTVYATITFLLWRHISYRWGRAILLVGSIFIFILIGRSRIYLGVHYPSDIIGGYFASGFWVGTAILFFQIYKEKRYNRNHNRQKKPA